MTNKQSKTNKTIETLVERGMLRREDAGKYYEEKGYYESAIRHYNENRSYEKAFDLSLKINRLDAAKDILKSIDESIDYAKRQLDKIAEENKAPASDREEMFCSAMGRFYNACAHMASREGLGGLRIKLQTKLKNAQQPKQETK